MLNLMRSVQRNTTYSSTTTTAVAFAKEGGQWRVAQ